MVTTKLEGHTYDWMDGWFILRQSKMTMISLDGWSLAVGPEVAGESNPGSEGLPACGTHVDECWCGSGSGSGFAHGTFGLRLSDASASLSCKTSFDHNPAKQPKSQYCKASLSFNSAKQA